MLLNILLGSLIVKICWRKSGGAVTVKFLRGPYFLSTV